MERYLIVAIFGVIIAALPCNGQSDVMLPLSGNSFRNIIRTKQSTPVGRKATISDVRIQYFGTDDPTNYTTFRYKTLQRILTDTSFDLQKPTVLYAHGYVELSNDESVTTIVEAYVKNGGSNLLVLDWANLGYGSYFTAGSNVELVGRETGRVLAKLLKAGLSLAGLHLVGHSLGSHIMAYASRQLAVNSYTVPRITGLDPALPGFYPPLAILGKPISSEDAEFVDIIHTDGGRYGTPLKTGHADFWPNGGSARQPGCTLNSILFTYEDFCSHWRSWRFWAEAVTGGGFRARRCGSYDQLLRGTCPDETVDMGPLATTERRVFMNATHLLPCSSEYQIMPETYYAGVLWTWDSWPAQFAWQLLPSYGGSVAIFFGRARSFVTTAPSSVQSMKPFISLLLN